MDFKGHVSGISIRIHFKERNYKTIGSLSSKSEYDDHAISSNATWSCLKDDWDNLISKFIDIAD